EVADRRAQLLKLHAEIFGGGDAMPAGFHEQGIFAPGAEPQAGDSLGFADEDEMLAIAQAQPGARGARFKSLWRGETGGYDDDDSKADCALCSDLAYFAGPNSAERIDRLFRRSGLMRPKWERQDYRDSTIAKALTRTTFYKRR